MSKLKTAASKAFNPRMVSLFKHAIENRDPVGVDLAIKKGVDADTPLFADVHALTDLVKRDYTQHNSRKTGLSEEQYEENTSEIVDTILASGATVAEPDQYASKYHDTLADQIFLTDNLVDGSSVIIQAIYETLSQGRNCYAPNIENQICAFADITGAGTEGVDTSMVVRQSINMLEAMHNIIVKRLQNPQTETEHKISQQFEDKLGYWKGPFPRPSLERAVAWVEQDQAANGALERATPAKGADKGPAQAQAAAQDQFSMDQYVVELPKKTSQQVLSEIDSEFIGLDSLKKSARRAVFTQQFELARAVNEIPNENQNHSTIFLGNPGLGKTTFARKKAELLVSMGLSGNRYVEVTRENIIGGFIGHTEQKMVSLFSSADVVFIDEAYNLTDGNTKSNDFGKKVVDALLTALENKPNLTVFLAGYPEEMEDLLNSNPGLRSRLTRYENFEDMTAEQLGKTLDLKLRNAGLNIEAEARQVIVDALEASKKTLGAKHFGNARLVRNVVRHLPEIMAERMFGEQQDAAIMKIPSKEDLMKVTVADVKAIDFTTIFGTKKKAKEEEYGIGFGAKLRPCAA